ncbi:MAG: gluconokinase [Cyanobacteria bacterium J06635_15]
MIVMGVSGVGKTTTGQQLAADLGWQFIDGDDFHPEINIDKMRHGIPLTDGDRLPWLIALQAAIADWLTHHQNIVLACSALKANYRTYLHVDHPEVHWVYLRGDKDLIRDRLKARTHHFMSPALLDSQFEALEVPKGAIAVDIANSPKSILQAIRIHLTKS